MAFGSTQSCFLGLIVLVVSSVPLGVHTVTVEEWCRRFTTLAASATLTPSILTDIPTMSRAFISLTNIVENLHLEGIDHIKPTVVGLGPRTGVDQFQTNMPLQDINAHTDGVIFAKDPQKSELEIWSSSTGEGLTSNLNSAPASLQNIISMQRPNNGPPFFTGEEMLIMQSTMIDLISVVNYMNVQLPQAIESNSGLLRINIRFSVVKRGLPVNSASGGGAGGPVSNVVKTTFAYAPITLTTSTTTSTTTTTSTADTTSITTTTFTGTSTTTDASSSSSTFPPLPFFPFPSDASKLSVYGVGMASSIVLVSITLFV